MSKNVLQLDHITMQFGGVVAVDDLSLEVNEGEIVALIGPNGAGKTTAFNTITGVYEPTNGMVSFMGSPIVRNHPQGKMKDAYKGRHADRFTGECRVSDEAALAAILDETDASHAEELMLSYDAAFSPEWREEDLAALAAIRAETDAEKNAALRAAHDAVLNARRESLRERDPHAFTSQVLDPTPDKITKLGMARTFQNIRLWKSQTVFDNVLITKHMLRTSNVFSATFRLNRAEEKRQREEVMELLRIVGLEDVKDELATSLPYGKQRRLEIARALATQPKLLMLDEPAAGMNPQETNELTEFIGRIRDEFHMTILLIEHHMDLVMDISDRIYVIDFGKLIASGTPEVIQNDQRVIDAYLGVEEDA